MSSDQPSPEAVVLSSFGFAAFIAPQSPTPRGRFSPRVVGTALVVAAPGDYIEIADRPEYDAAGVEPFDFRPVDAPDGAAVLVVEHGFAMHYRVWRDGGAIVEGQPFDWGIISDPGGLGDEPAIAAGVDVRFLPPPPTDPASDVTVDVSALVRRSGLPPEQVDVVIPWSGPVPSRDGVPTTAVLTTAMLPSSAVLVSLTWSRPTGDGGHGGSDRGDGLDSTVLPGGGIAIAKRSFAFRCTTTDLSGSGDSELTSLVVVAPVGATTARLLDEAGTVPDELPLLDGVLITTDEELIARTTSVVPRRDGGGNYARGGLLTGD